MWRSYNFMLIERSGSGAEHKAATGRFRSTPRTTCTTWDCVGHSNLGHSNVLYRIIVRSTDCNTACRERIGGAEQPGTTGRKFLHTANSNLGFWWQLSGGALSSCLVTEGSKHSVHAIIASPARVLSPPCRKAVARAPRAIPRTAGQAYSRRRARPCETRRLTRPLGLQRSLAGDVQSLMLWRTPML